MTPPRWSGADSVRAAERVRAERGEQWPFPHVYPPPDAVPVNEIRAVAVPGTGQTVVVLTYKVPAGMRFIFKSILQDWDGGAVGDGATWTVTDNAPAGLTDIQAMPVQGLINVPVNLGSLVAGTRWPFARAYEFPSQHVIRSVATNGLLGSGNFVSAFAGYLIPDLG